MPTPRHYLLALLIPISAALAVAWGGVWSLATVVLLFVGIPLADEAWGVFTANAEDEDTRRDDARFAWATWAWVPLQTVVLAWGVWRIGRGDFGGLEAVGVTCSLGAMAGVGINVAHELMHRKDRVSRALAEALTTLSTYTHFCVEHVHGHHKHVATPHDPATSRLGESVYAFVPRSVTGGLRSFWRIESGLAARRNDVGTLRDRRIRYPLDVVAVLGLALAIGGPLGFAAFVGQAVIGVVMLEVVNYLEHYGLQRKEVASGRYERVRPHHSWNSGHWVSGLMLFGLPRHSDHHFMASRPYAILRHHADAPQLPAGYAGMFLVALVPPVWRAVMDPRVADVRGRTRL